MSDNNSRMTTWWDRCSAHERAYWLKQAGSTRTADAWQAYRRALKAPQPVTTPTGRSCAECGHLPTEMLVMPDGNVEFCPGCGHQMLSVQSQESAAEREPRHTTRPMSLSRRSQKNY